MARTEHVGFRLNEEEKKELEKAKEIMELDGKHGGDSKAYRKAIRYFLNNKNRPIRDFEARYGSEEIKIIKKAIERGVI